MDRRAHWENVYRTKQAAAFSWHQTQPTRSLELIAEAGAGPDTAIIDVGGGDSLLVDELLGQQLGRIAVLDLSGAALERARARLGSRARHVQWIEADITQVELPAATYDIWHDRAVFHFLTDADDRQRYVAAARRTLRPGGTAIIATFAADGPVQCSGLPVARYSPEMLLDTFGNGFELVRGFGDVHRTPSGGEQRFTYAMLRAR